MTNKYVVRVDGKDYPMITTSKTDLLDAIKSQINDIIKYQEELWEINRKAYKMLEDAIQNGEQIFLYVWENLSELKNESDINDRLLWNSKTFTHNNLSFPLTYNSDVQVYTIDEWYWVNQTTFAPASRNSQDDGVYYDTDTDAEEVFDNKLNGRV